MARKGSYRPDHAASPDGTTEAKECNRSSVGPLSPSRELQLLRLEHQLTRQKLGHARSELEAARTALEDQYEFAPVAYVTLSRDGSIRHANLAAARLIDLESGALLGRNFGRFVDQGDHERYVHHFHRLCSGESLSESCDLRLRRPDGKGIDVRLMSVAACGAHGQAREVWSALVDVLSFKDVESRLTLANAVIEAVGDAVVVTDPQGVIDSANPTMLDIAGDSAGSLQGKSLRDICRADWRTSFDEIWEEVHRCGRWSGELTVSRSSERGIVTWASLAALCDADGNVEHVAGVLTDLTEIKKAEAEIYWQANHDVVTCLPNRAMFLERLAYLLRQAQRSRTLVALLFLDLDRFKRINDELGHSAGDDLLAQMAKRLVGCLRDSDTVARMGGDEFAIILPDIEDAQGASLVAEKVAQALREPFTVDDHEVRTGCSIGIALCPDDSEDADDLLRYADMAMYRAKKDGCGSYQFYLAEMTETARARTRLENELKRAIPNGELGIEYQAVYDLRTGGVAGMEALLRWRHPKRGVLAAESFVAFADQAGQGALFGFWLLDRIRSDLATLGSAFRPERMFLSLNVSGRQLADRMGSQHLLRLVEQALAAGVTPVVEVAEVLAVGLTAASATTLGRVRNAGARLAIDNFGAGNSPIESLTALPFEIVKIDRALTGRLSAGTSHERLAGAIVAMAHALDLTVVGVGVETTDQLEVLRGVGCDCGQGYLLGRPADAGAIRAILTGEGRSTEPVAAP